TQGHVPVGVANLDGGDTTRDRKEALTHLRLEQELEQALERGEFRLLYQPIVCLADCTTAGFEALIRWASPTRGLVPPDQFIPAAEESQLIVDIGRWTLRAGCAAIRRMEQLREQTAGPPGHPLFISVNLAARQLATKDIYEDVTRAVLDAGIAPPQLKLELTEGQLIGNWDRSMDLLNRLRAFGVQVAVDDFGTGYSSLSYLHRFPVDTLKIDRSFVASLLENERSREILRMLGQLARALSMHIIAEGVEHPEQASYLGMLGFEFAQGYLFSRPVSEEQAAALVNKRWEVGGLVVPCNPGKVGLHSDS
ncbi:MAG: putative bifunctional diguanylate cyclase/phosphodiesterase, partial [Nevskiales bacterium]